MTVSQHLEDQRKAVRRIGEEVERLLAPLGAEAFNWKPDAQTWSVGECLEHLNVVGGLYVPKIEAAIAQGPKAAATDAPYRSHWTGRMAAKSVEPDKGMKIKTFSIFEPSASALSKEKVVANFHEKQKSFLSLLAAAQETDLRRATVTTPVSRWVRFQLGDVFPFLLAHERRHVVQAQRLTRLSNFGR